MEISRKALELVQVCCKGGQLLISIFARGSLFTFSSLLHFLGTRFSLIGVQPSSFCKEKSAVLFIRTPCPSSFFSKISLRRSHIRERTV